MDDEVGRKSPPQRPACAAHSNCHLSIRNQWFGGSISICRAAETGLFTTIYIFCVRLLCMPLSRPKKTDSEDVLYEYAIGALARRMPSVPALNPPLRPRSEPYPHNPMPL